MGDETTDIPIPAGVQDDRVTECPSCKFRAEDAAVFSTCPHCGLIVAKYLAHRRQMEADKAPRPHAFEIMLKRLPKRIRADIAMLMIAAVLAICCAAILKYAVNSNSGHAEKKQGQAPHAESELIKAVQRHDAESVRHLLQWGANPNVVVNGQSLIEIALLSEELEIAKLLVQKGAVIPRTSLDERPTLIQECIDRNLILSVSYLLSLHIPLEDMTPKGHSTFIHAAANGYIEMVRMLIENGISVNTRNRINTTALHEAVRKGNTEMTRFLIKHGADVNAHGQFGYTPLMLGVKYDEIVAMLIDAGADINARSDSNNTPLHSAVSSLNVRSVKLLIEKGAYVAAKDDRGVTPLKITTFHRNPSPDPFPEMAALLKSAGAVE